ncbi:MAG: hypothetical protein QXS90_02245 [Candidatus Diapherotrites archaeon]
MKLTDFLVQNKNKLNVVSTLPEGETLFDLPNCSLEEQTTEFDGKVKTNYIITQGDNKYFLPVSVLREINKVFSEGATKVKVIRKGKTKLDTKYIVLRVG